MVILKPHLGFNFYVRNSLGSFLALKLRVSHGPFAWPTGDLGRRCAGIRGDWSVTSLDRGEGVTRGRGPCMGPPCSVTGEVHLGLSGVSEQRPQETALPRPFPARPEVPRHRHILGPAELSVGSSLLPRCPSRLEPQLPPPRSRGSAGPEPTCPNPHRSSFSHRRAPASIHPPARGREQPHPPHRPRPRRGLRPDPCHSLRPARWVLPTCVAFTVHTPSPPPWRGTAAS